MRTILLLKERWGSKLRVAEVGRTAEDRPILELAVGVGPERLFFWSQMHGDEPSATPALLDLIEYLLRHQDTPEIAALLDRYTLVFLPMLNPDGAARGIRRTAWGIDLNRDARRLVTPEARVLKELVLRHRPVLGFNLHDQNRRRTTGKPRELAAGSVLAVVGGESDAMAPQGRELAMRAAVALVQAVEPRISGRMARYDDSWNPRAFGDVFTASGFPVLLVESGGVMPGESLAQQARLNFVGLGAVLGGFVRDRLASVDLEAYERIPENESDLWVDVLLTGAEVWQPQSGRVARYPADLGFDRLISDRAREGCAPLGKVRSKIVELGDGTVFAAGEQIDLSDRVITPVFRLGLEGARRAKWLTPIQLERLVRLGVGELVWWVEPRKLWPAGKQAQLLQRPGYPRIVVVGDRSELPPIRWTQSHVPSGGRFTELLEALAELGGRPAKGVDPDSFLRSLWGHAERPLLAPDRPADLLVWRLEKTGGLSELETVWLEGRRVEVRE